MILIINTAKGDAVEVILAQSRADFLVEKTGGKRRQAEQLLPLVEKRLKKAKCPISDLTGIGVVSGPGGFTALRIGIVTANTLAYALGIPVAGINLAEFGDNTELVAVAEDKIKNAKVGEIVMPEYGSEPHIGQSS